MQKLFPIVMIILSLAAAAVYIFSKDYARGTYWLSASVLTASTLFM